MNVGAAVESERTPDLLDHTCRLIRDSINQSLLNGCDPHAISPAIDEIAQALRTVRSGAPTPSFAASPWTAAARPLLDAMRRHVLLAAHHAGDAEAFAESHAWLMSLERLHDALLSDDLYLATEHLGGANALEMLVSVAHDMRSPLGAILLLVERVRSGHSGDVNEPQFRQLGLAYSAAFALSTMVSDLMELARGSGRLIAAEPVPFAIADVVRGVDEMVRPVAEEKGLQLVVTMPPREARLGHPAALGRVLLNLTTNACKFTQQGSVRLEMRCLSEQGFEFLVSDTGRGFSEHPSKRAHSAFRTGGTHRGIKGVLEFSSEGLGLAICRKLIFAMGGELQIASREEGGTCARFTLVLPAYC